MMINIKNVLVPTDFSDCAQSAYELALHIAKQFNAKLTVLHARVMFSDDPSTIPADYKDIKQSQEKIDRFLLDRLQKDTAKAVEGIFIEQKVTRGYSAAPAILEFIHESKIDLVVMGTHGHTGLSHFLLGSVAEQVVRYSPCPVVTLRREAGVIAQPHRILVPFDFSELSKKAFHYAVNFARKFDSKIDLVYVVEEDVHPALYAWGLKSIKDLIPDIKSRVEKSFKSTIETEKATQLNVAYYVLAGKPHRELISLAQEQGHDLIIIATHAHSGIDKFLLGSVTEKIIRAAHCAVLTLKLDEREIIA
jgi:nucleotide-binding universal stress UspA family protein